MIPPRFARICQTKLPRRPWAEPALNRLPGTVPVGADEWLIADEAFAQQMALRDHLVAEHPDAVLARTNGADMAIEETYETMQNLLAQRPGYSVTRQGITRPDGETVRAEDKLAAIARSVQEDICILNRDDPSQEHRLIAAALAFPASWTLAEKIGRPLTAIHAPVAPYDDNVAPRVQRLFDALRPDHPLMRMNALKYSEAVLFQPRSEQERRNETSEPAYLRAERQCLVKLPRTGAVVFSIHTYVIPLAALPEQDRSAVLAKP